MIEKMNGLVESQRRRLRRARQRSNEVDFHLGWRPVTKPLPVEQMETVLMPAVTSSGMRARTTTPLPEAWPGGPERPEFLDSDKDFGTVELPMVERYGVQVMTTHELVREEVKRFLREHHRSPDAVLLSPLRLLNVPSRWWPKYLVVFQDGTQTFVALRELPGLREDEARGVVGVADRFYL